MNRGELLSILPLAKSKADTCLAPLNAAMAEFRIDTPLRQAAFLAQLGHESRHLTDIEENLNYSADGLANTWPSRYALRSESGTYATLKGRKLPNGLAKRLHRKPQAIANNVYANRMGNGVEASGDGWRYRGAGWIQLTGKENQLAAALYFDIALDHIGDWLRTPEGAARSAAWFWKANGCDGYADQEDFDGVCDRVNLGRKTERVGDAIGYADRLDLYKKAKEVLCS